MHTTSPAQRRTTPSCPLKLESLTVRLRCSICGQVLRSAGVLDKLFYFSPGHNYSYLTQYGPLECSAYFPPPSAPCDQKLIMHVPRCAGSRTQ